MSDIDYQKFAEALYNYKNPSSPSVTLKRLTGEYESLIENKFSEKYLLCVSNTDKQLLRYFSPEREIRYLDQRTIEQYLLNRFKKAPCAAEIDYRNLRAMFNVAIRWNYLDKNVVASIKLPRRQKEERITMSINSMYKVRDELIKMGKKTFADIVEWAFFTGMRGSEIINLMYSDIDLNKRIIRVGSASFSTKSRKIRVIPVSTPLYEILKRRGLKKSGYIFNKNHGRYTLDAVSKSFKKPAGI